MVPCIRCRVGRLKPANVPYAQMVDGKLMMLPDMPASVCDVCGEIEYDSSVMINIQYLIHQQEVRQKRPIPTKPQTRPLPPLPPVSQGV